MKMTKTNNNQINILIVVRWPVGGIRTFIRYVYNRFPAHLYRFALIAPDHEETHILIDDLERLNLTYHPVSSNPSVFELASAVLRQIIFGNFDIVHSHGFTSGSCSAFSARIFRIPHIMTSHDVLSDKQFSGIAGYIKHLILKQNLAQIRTIHSVSYDAQNNLIEYFPMLKEKCIVILNGIEVDRFQNAKKIFDLREKIGVANDHYLIGFLGRFMKQKGFSYLVDAIELLLRKELRKKISVVAIGDGGFIREEKAALQNRGLEKHFHFLNFIPNVASVIKDLDLVVVPSLWEACPLLPMEVLTCGVPLLASNCIGLREVTLNTPTIMVKAGDSIDLERGIRFCLENDIRQQFSDYAPLAAKRFNVNNSSELIEKLIRETIHE
jgi:glycosyltransferase involved in cell wall biosynthesis